MDFCIVESVFAVIFPERFIFAHHQTSESIAFQIARHFTLLKSRVPGYDRQKHCRHYAGDAAQLPRCIVRESTRGPLFRFKKV